MRARQHMGRAGTPVIPRDWEANHGQVIGKTMQAAVSLRKPGSTKTWNDTNDQSDYDPLDPYAVDQAARIQVQSNPGTDRTTTVAEETVQVTGYLITLTYCRDLGAEPAVGDLIDVTTSDDQLAVGRTFKVTELPIGSLRFERDLFCTLLDPGGDLP